MRWWNRVMAQKRRSFGSRVRGLVCLLGMALAMTPGLAWSQEDPPDAFGDLLEGLPAPGVEEKRSQAEAPVGEGDLPSLNPLQVALKAMQSADRQLQDTGASDASVTAQQQALDAIDALLQQMQPPPESSSASTQPEPGDPQPAEEEAQPGDSPGEQNGEGEAEAEGEEDAESDSEGEAEQSMSTAGPGEPGEDPDSRDREKEAAQAVQESVWGHLPSRVRDSLRATLPQQYHPKYRGAIESYYRRLAEMPDE